MRAISKALGVFGGIGLVISVAWIIMALEHWYFTYPDLSQLAFALGFGVFGLIGGVTFLYFAYDINWKDKKNKDDKDTEDELLRRIDKNTQSLDSATRTFHKFWEKSLEDKS